MGHNLQEVDYHFDVKDILHKKYGLSHKQAFLQISPLAKGL